MLNPNFVDLDETIGNDLHFWMRRTDANTWTININGNVITLDDKTQVSERFIEMNKLAVSLGTWNSSSAVEYTVSELWSYNCIEYDPANPPAFVKSVRSQSTTPTKTTASNKTTSQTPVTTSAAPNSSSGTKATTGSAGQDPVSEPVSGDSSESLVPPDSSEVTTPTGSPNTSEADADKDADADASDEASKGVGWVVWLVIALIVLVLGGGGTAFYFLFLRKPSGKGDGNP